MTGILYIRLQQLKELIANYEYPKPVNVYLKEFFSNNKKLGGRDRKQLKQWFYAYFKSPFVNAKLDLETELMHVLADDQTAFLASLKEAANFKPTVKADSVFPLSQNVSSQISCAIEDLKAEKLTWIRFINEKVKIDSDLVVKRKDGLLGVAPNISINLPEKDYQVQDLASYQAAMLCVNNMTDGKVWDVCSGSGGKALTMIDVNQNLDYYASDLRLVIVRNMLSRMNGRAIHSAIIDMSEPLKTVFFKSNAPSPENSTFEHSSFNYIVADVPCSGSGTWGRNPQHLRFFDEDNLTKYQKLQQSIITNALPFLKPKGKLFYMTCSVYEKENESQLAYFEKELGLKVVKSTYLGQAESDVMFWACLERK